LRVEGRDPVDVALFQRGGLGQPCAVHRLRDRESSFAAAVLNRLQTFRNNDSLSSSPAQACDVGWAKAAEAQRRPRAHRLFEWWAGPLRLRSAALAHPTDLRTRFRRGDVA